MSGGSCRGEDSIQIFGRGREALFVVRLATEPRYHDVVRRRVRRKSNSTGHDQQQQAPHITPHFRRNNHSAISSPRRSKKTIGISHSSLVLRTEMPASEYETSRGRFFNSDGSQ